MLLHPYPYLLPILLHITSGSPLLSIGVNITTRAALSNRDPLTGIAAPEKYRCGGDDG